MQPPNPWPCAGRADTATELSLGPCSCSFKGADGILTRPRGSLFIPEESGTQISCVSKFTPSPKAWLSPYPHSFNSQCSPVHVGVGAVCVSIWPRNVVRVGLLFRPGDRASWSGPSSAQGPPGVSLCRRAPCARRGQACR